MSTLAVLAGLGILLQLATLALIYRGFNKMNTELDNVTRNEQDLITKTDALLAFAATQNALIAQLQATIANGGIDPTTAQALQKLADDMGAESAKVAAFLAPAPAPVG